MRIFVRVHAQNYLTGGALGVVVLLRSGQPGHAGHRRLSPDRHGNGWPSPDRCGWSEL